MPHNLDFRGRAYPIPPHLNHIGDDLSRGLLLFAESRPLGQSGLRWLKIHLANVFGYDKASFDEREKFTDEHIEEIKDNALRPLDVSQNLKFTLPIVCLDKYLAGQPVVAKSGGPVAMSRDQHGAICRINVTCSRVVSIQFTRAPGWYMQWPATLCCTWRGCRRSAACELGEV